jgi:hypothetical protein
MPLIKLFLSDSVAPANGTTIYCILSLIAIVDVAPLVLILGALGDLGTAGTRKRTDAEAGIITLAADNPAALGSRKPS